MIDITICNLDDGIERGPRLQVASHRRPMGEEGRHIPCQAVGRAPAPVDFGESVHRRFAALGGVDLDLPPREAIPEAPRFD